MPQRPVGLDMKISQPNMELNYPLVKSYVWELLGLFLSRTVLSGFLGLFCLGLFCLGILCYLGLFCPGLFCLGLFCLFAESYCLFLTIIMFAVAHAAIIFSIMIVFFWMGTNYSFLKNIVLSDDSMQSNCIFNLKRSYNNEPNKEYLILCLQVRRKRRTICILFLRKICKKNLTLLENENFTLMY